jgi:hypothetical protein
LLCLRISGVPCSEIRSEAHGTSWRDCRWAISIAAKEL